MGHECDILRNRWIFHNFLTVAAPDFVGSMTQGDFVYFFFRETAVEYINCGKVMFTRLDMCNRFKHAICPIRPPRKCDFNQLPLL